MITSGTYKYFVVLLLLLGSSPLIFAQWSDWIAPEWTDTISNPIADQNSAIQEGRILFNSICFVCHGTEGKGDGINAPALEKLPADLTSIAVQKQSDGALFWKISEGKPPMLSFKTSLSEEQRWKIISYIRQFSNAPEVTNDIFTSRDPEPSISTKEENVITSTEESIYNPFAGVVDGSKLFFGTCASCHTIGKGKLVGPDLIGVSHRHPKEWLFNWIKCPICRIEAGDPAAVKIYEEYDKVLMPDHDYLEDGQLKIILEYIDQQSELIASQLVINKDDKAGPGAVEQLAINQSEKPSTYSLSSGLAFWLIIASIALMIYVVYALLSAIDVITRNNKS